MIHIMKTKSSTRVVDNANAPTAQHVTRLQLRDVEVAVAREFDRAVLRAVERQIDDGLAARVRCWRQQAPASAISRNQLAAIRVASHPPEQRMVPAGAAVTAIGVDVTDDSTVNDPLSGEQPSDVTLALYVLREMSESTRKSICTQRNRTRPESA